MPCVGGLRAMMLDGCIRRLAAFINYPATTMGHRFGLVGRIASIAPCPPSTVYK